MVISKNKNWFICTISAGGFHNWELCKEVSSWGIPSNGRNLSMNQVEPGDGLLFYWASKGLIGQARATSAMKRPLTKEEAPWAGGVFRYGIVIPFSLELELQNPMPFQFKDGIVVGSKLNAASLRRGFSRIDSEDGKFFFSELKLKQKAE